MNHSVYFDPPFSDDERRRALYEGQLLVYTPRRSSLAVCEFAREMIEAAFAPTPPPAAQHHMPASDYAALLGRLKPAFIHHPESKRLIAALLRDMGCDPEQTYFDVPRMRSSTSGHYLTSGIAYAWHPHRDTWYSAPQCQLNWWTPIYPMTADNGMAFHPRYYSRPVPNDSSRYNYYEWNERFRGAHVAQLTKSDPRPLPRPTAPLDLDPQIRLVVPVGGIVLFSAAQLHSSVPNTSGVTRFSIDFRTVHLGDARRRLGAPNLDAACTGSTMRDYLSAADLARLPQDVIQLYEDGTLSRGKALYCPEPA